MKKLLFLSCNFFFLFWMSISSVFASIVEYDIDINYKTINVTGKSTKALAMNNSIPGPTLRFREGDITRIRVKNSMDRESFAKSLARNCS
jgi:hypothetical protein